KHKILCLNMVENGNCKYYNNCMYAHSLKEQKVDENRKIAYNIIQSHKWTKPITNIIYDTLLQLTKTCKDCNKNQCTGGYNCKFGAINKKWQICEQDLKSGN